MRRVVSALLPLLGLGLFVVIVRRAGVGAIAGRLGAVRALPLALAIALVPVILAVRGLRWHRILALGGVEWRARRAVAAWAVGFFASAVTPAKAGDAIRAWYAHGETGCGLGEALASVFVDRLFDLLLVVAAGIVSVLVFSARYTALPSAGVVLVAGAALAAVATIATSRRIVRVLARPFIGLLVPARMREGLADSFHAFYDALARTLATPRAVAEVAAWTLVGWGLIVLLAMAVARAVDVGVSPGYLLLAMPIITIVELVPVSVSGVGTRDAAVVYLFSVVGVDRAAAVAFSLGYLAVGTWVSAAVGLVVWLRNPVSLRASGGRAGAADGTPVAGG